MGNEKIIAQLDRPSLLHLSSFLSLTIAADDDSFWEIADLEMFWVLDLDAINCCEKLTQCQRLKFLQQIINTLAKEEEEAAAISKQLQLPLG
ncbi:hypothetical protein VF14_36700 [Nostoc linckia z18]|uniref:Uncharacterized protein n=2 Tax=Nostoc linckia TaxID=92942 RepID=A0A9Q5Z448_NOSLI|nr:hypothetical protein [Nostoc linckia]PHK36360.1 hypothetical protein VF13_37160 [Nostoc linckia z16]PHK39241.1 hypothetical protein VF12_14930 [Nostoc linckia z15]PHJ56165.1 hypothetical protein VF03_37835 [Nostoc linckia z2]PHJ59250.1 hypothetical protein VF02_25550 [Nostoc linckia z1]PHJ66638.1 hypothetical protein VF05_19095 [Nostoc linckia z3]